MVSQEKMDKVTEYLIPINQTNNLAARIIVLCRAVNLGKLNRFNKDQVFGVRKVADKNKDLIADDILKDIHEICDYFESLFIANELV